MVIKKVIALILSLIIIAGLFTACGPSNNNGRFVMVYEQDMNAQDTTRIYMDTETGVLYYYVQHNANGGGGLSVLYNADGTIMTGK